MGGAGSGDDVDLIFARCMAAAERVWEDLVVEKDRMTMAMWRSKAMNREEGGEVEKDTWSTRGRGARFVWVTAAGMPATNAPLANKATVTWTAIVRYLKGVAAASGVVGRVRKVDRECWRHSCNCRNRLRHIALRREEDGEVQRIQEWLKAMFLSDQWVEGKVVGYVAEAVRYLGVVQTSLNSRMHEDWMRWLVDGPAGGIGRQHRFLRTPQGWTPSSLGRKRGSSTRRGRRRSPIMTRN